MCIRHHVLMMLLRVIKLCGKHHVLMMQWCLYVWSLYVLTMFTDRKTDRHSNRRTDRRTDGRTDGQTDGQTDLWCWQPSAGGHDPRAPEPSCRPPPLSQRTGQHCHRTTIALTLWYWWMMDGWFINDGWRMNGWRVDGWRRAYWLPA